MGFFLGLGALIVVWLGSREVIEGRITVGEFVAFNSYLTMLSWPMIAFGWVTNMLQRGMASWKRMLEILDVEPAISDLGLRIADDASPQSAATPHIRNRVRNAAIFGVRSNFATSPSPTAMPRRCSTTCRRGSRRGRPSRSSA